MSSTAAAAAEYTEVIDKDDEELAQDQSTIDQHLDDEIADTVLLTSNVDNNNIDDDDEEHHYLQEQQDDPEDLPPSIKNNMAAIRRKTIKSEIGSTISKITSVKKEDLKLDTGKYIKSIIYGGMDGLVSIFVSVAVVATGHDKIMVLLVIALAKLVAGAISMGMGDYLGTQADVDFAKGERMREEWEVEYYPEGEKKEMVEIYVSKGIPVEVATEVVDILAKNKKGFVDIMMVEELGIMPDSEQEVAWKNGLINFISFTIFGIIPIFPYLVFLIVAKVNNISLAHGNTPTFVVVIALTVVTLFLMGVFQAKSTGASWIWKGLITVILGVIGAFTGFATVEIVRLIDPSINING
ncbi:hypothetical protein SAMD00019534_000130, partial [Acytostelium subglobosum LB1]|uniref:hypothetical protein n=1 Tax=Acytostelium subglobosum LB1 TaxID=1410327 RepID=UPI000645174D